MIFQKLIQMQTNSSKRWVLWLIYYLHYLTLFLFQEMAKDKSDEWFKKKGIEKEKQE